MSVTPDILKAHFETDLTDAAIQRLIDDAAEEIVDRYGDNSSITEEHILATPSGYRGHDSSHVGRRHIYPKKKVDTVTSVKEGVTLAADDMTTLVADTDYRLIFNGRAIERIGTDFLQRVEIVYTPITDVSRRDRVTIDLVKLAIQYQGLKSEKVGDYSASFTDYQKERESLLRGLNSGIRSYA